MGAWGSGGAILRRRRVFGGHLLAEEVLHVVVPRDRDAAPNGRARHGDLDRDRRVRRVGQEVGAIAEVGESHRAGQVVGREDVHVVQLDAERRQAVGEQAAARVVGVVGRDIIPARHRPHAVVGGLTGHAVGRADADRVVDVGGPRRRVHARVDEVGAEVAGAEREVGGQGKHSFRSIGVYFECRRQS